MTGIKFTSTNDQNKNRPLPSLSFYYQSSVLTFLFLFLKQNLQTNKLTNLILGNIHKAPSSW